MIKLTKEQAKGVWLADFNTPEQLAEIHRLLTMDIEYTKKPDGSLRRSMVYGLVIQEKIWLAKAPMGAVGLHIVPVESTLASAILVGPVTSHTTIFSVEGREK